MRAFTLAAAALGLICGLASCTQYAPAAAADPPRMRGELRLVTLNLPTCYYLGAQRTEGLEFEPAGAYAAAPLTNTQEWSRVGDPNVLVGFELPKRRPVQWIVRRGAPGLLASVNSLFRELGASGQRAQLMQESSGDTRAVQYEESHQFHKHVGDRLSRYRSWFEAAAATVGLDWRLLAAIGYQESKWDPQAQSSDGALGVMMLTADTAQALGIEDRANPRQSIFAGARYLAQVRAMIPARIPEPDRTWLMVAAYNVGFGHLEDARIITEALGKDPDSWPEVRARLPLLTQQRWYAGARRGYARGWEPVQFVDRIQRYLTLLARQPGHSDTAAASARATPVPSDAALAVSAPQPPAAAVPLPAPTTPCG